MSKYALLFVGLLALAGVANAAALFDGKLQVMPVKGPVDRGTTLAVTLSFSPKTDAARDQRTITERQAQFYLYPYRFSLYNPAPVPVLAAKKAPGQYELSVPATVNPDWYMLIATVTPQPGEAFNHDATDDVAAPPIDLDQKNPLACYQVIGIRDAAGAPAVRVSTERARCVFCPGEQLRLYVTARGKAGVQGAVQVKLTPRGDRATAPLLVAQGTLNSAAGKEQVVAFDLPAKLTSAIAPGRYDLTVLLNNQVMDNYPVAFVAAGLQGAGARWWHGLPFGLGSGFSADSVTPGWLEKNAGLSLIHI